MATGATIITIGQYVGLVVKFKLTAETLEAVVPSGVDEVLVVCNTSLDHHPKIEEPYVDMVVVEEIYFFLEKKVVLENFMDLIVAYAIISILTHLHTKLMDKKDNFVKKLVVVMEL